MANVRKIREEDKQYILDFWEIQTVDEIAKHLGISPRTLARWAVDLGMPNKVNRNNSRKPYGRRTIIVEMSVRCKKCCTICEKYSKCEIACKLDTTESRKMVCWNFELDEELKIN